MHPVPFNLVLYTAIGALLGTQNGRDVEIVNTFELAMEPDGTTVDAGFLITRRDQCAYSSCVFESDVLRTHMQISKSSPL